TQARFDAPVRYATIAAVIDAKSGPLTAEDERSPAERQADALADVCGYVADHGDTDVLPSAGGQRPPATDIAARAPAERQADALADVCGYVADHGDTDVLPSAGGQRPHLNVIVELSDLEN